MFIPTTHETRQITSQQSETRTFRRPSRERTPQTGEISQLMSQISDQKLRIEELKHKLARLEAEKNQEKEVYLRAAKKWEREVNKKKEECDTMNKELEETKRFMESRVLEITGQKNDEIAAMKSEMYNTRLELSKKITELNTELKGLKEFQDRKEECFKQVNYWKKRCDELISLYGTKAEAEKGKEVSEKKEVKLRIQERVKSVDVSKLNMSVQEEALVEYQTVNFKQECKIKKLKEKMFALNDYITQEHSSRTKESETIRCRLQAHIHDLEKENQNLKEEIQGKIKENKNLKTLSQIILDQRSEVEEFFIEVLDHIKEQVKKQKHGEVRKKIPEIFAKGKIESKTKMNWNKIDFGSLDWEEKQRMLTLLFSKLNSGLLPGNWRDTMFGEKVNDAVNKSFNTGLNLSHVSTKESHRTTTRGIL